MSADHYTEWDAAYVLGALSSGERLEFEGHLATCDDCSARVAELAGMPGVLARLDRPSAEALRDLPADGLDAGARPGTVAHLARRVRRRRRLVALAGSAAIVASAVGGAAIAAVPAAPALAQTRLTPVGGSAVSAELSATAVGWGTKLSWACRYPSEASSHYAAATYQLVVTTTSGQATKVASWGAHGDGATGLSAATSIPRSSIRSVDIRTDTGTVLAEANLSD